MVDFVRTKFRTLPEEPRLTGLITVVPLVIAAFVWNLPLGFCPFAFYA